MAEVLASASRSHSFAFDGFFLGARGFVSLFRGAATAKPPLKAPVLFPNWRAVPFNHHLDLAEGGFEGLSRRALDVLNEGDERVFVCGESFGGIWKMSPVPVTTMTRMS